MLAGTLPILVPSIRPDKLLQAGHTKDLETVHINRGGVPQY